MKTNFKRLLAAYKKMSNEELIEAWKGNLIAKNDAQLRLDMIERVIRDKKPGLKWILKTHV